MPSDEACDMLSMIDENDLEWLAGFADGELTVGAYLRGNSLTTRLAIEQKELAPLEVVVEIAGGKIHPDRTRDCWVWTRTGAPAFELARMLASASRSVSKRGQLEEFARLEELRARPGRPLSPEQHAVRRGIVSTIKKLKRLVDTARAV